MKQLSKFIHIYLIFMFLKIIVGNDSIDNLQYYYLSELGEYQFYHSSGVCGYYFHNSSRVHLDKRNYRVHYSSWVLSPMIYSLFIRAMQVILSSNSTIRVFLFEAKTQDTRLVNVQTKDLNHAHSCNTKFLNDSRS